MKLTALFTWQWDTTSLFYVVPSHCQKSSEKYRVLLRICSCKMKELLVFTQQGRLKAILFVCICYLLVVASIGSQQRKDPLSKIVN